MANGTKVLREVFPRRTQISTTQPRSCGSKESSGTDDESFPVRRSQIVQVTYAQDQKSSKKQLSVLSVKRASTTRTGWLRRGSPKVRPIRPQKGWTITRDFTQNERCSALTSGSILLIPIPTNLKRSKFSRLFTYSQKLLHDFKSII